MRLSAFSIAVAVAVVVASAPTTAAQPISPPNAVPSIAPSCESDLGLTISGTVLRGGARIATVLVNRLSTPASKRLRAPTSPQPSPPCVVAGYPSLANASAPQADLPVGHLSLESSASVEMGTPASFELAYPSTGGAPCVLAIRVGATKALPLTLANCGTPSEFDVSSYTPGAYPGIGTPPQIERLPARPSTCRPRDIVPRAIVRSTASGRTSATVALQNRSTSRCGLPANIRVLFLDPNSKEIPLRIEGTTGADHADGRLLIVGPGHEASLGIDVPSRGARGACAPNVFIAAALVDGVTATAPTTLAVCSDGAPARATSLRLGVPLARELPR